MATSTVTPTKQATAGPADEQAADLLTAADLSAALNDPVGAYLLRREAKQYQGEGPKAGEA